MVTTEVRSCPHRQSPGARDYVDTVVHVAAGAQPISVYRKVRSRLGRLRRHVRRIWWERRTGKEYRRWLAAAAHVRPSSVDNEFRIAVIVAVFDPPVEYLSSCLDSVVRQSARNWQLVISDDGSRNSEVIAFLDTFEAQHADDERVVVLRGANGGISAAQNRAIEAVSTEYFGWLDHDDMLDPRALALVSDTIAGSAQSLELIYSDEDKIDDAGRHFELYCKPEFSPELLLTQMYVCHFTVFRTQTVRELGGFRSDMDGAQDFDLVLRMSDRLSRERTARIPLPLYHWRYWGGSTSQSIDVKPWAQEATARAQQAYLDATSGGGTVTPSHMPGLNEVHPRLLTVPRVSVVIPTAGSRSASGERYIDAAVKSLKAQSTAVEMEIIAVTTNELDPIPHVDRQVVYRTNAFNFAEAINLGVSQASSPWILILNDDTELQDPESLLRMLELAQRPDVGVVGAKLTYPDGRLQHVGIVMVPSGPTHPMIGKSGGDPGYFGSTLTPRNFSAVTAAAMLVSAELFHQLGGFDTTFAQDFNDIDFCLRAGEIGKRVAWTPYAHFTHHEGVSIVRKVAAPAERVEFERRWSSVLAHDPYYSPALHQGIERLYEPR